MGVSGAGKSTIGEMLAKKTNFIFIDADDFHPNSNKEKMKNGIPLSEEDRIPWLETLRNVLRQSLEDKKSVILGCSALQKQYREILRSADPNYVPQSYVSSTVKFVLLDATAEVLAARLEKRAAQGKHFMPSTFLKSQLELLQIDDLESISKDTQKRLNVWDCKIDNVKALFVTYITLLGKLSDCGELETMKEIWDEMEADGFAPDAMSTKPLNSGSDERERREEAMLFFEEMAEYGCKPNRAIFNFQ
ncbi:gluconokinase-like [Humulus lupulus]|uniref:gluconokinase-like n=1 Tax=Humulus lupulus TaxID=3486 RepID=UPI002B40A5A7|nr:gluconokinase-like [Humulus lupulus]